MSERTSPQTLTWRGEVEFRGTPEEFVAFREALATDTVRIAISEIAALDIRRGYLAPVHLDPGRFLSALNESNSVRLRATTIRDINGGIRTPHLHLGDEIVLIEREQFKTILGELARDVFAERVGSSDDFYDIVGPLAAAQPR